MGGQGWEESMSVCKNLCWDADKAQQLYGQNPAMQPGGKSHFLRQKLRTWAGSGVTPKAGIVMQPHS